MPVYRDEKTKEIIFPLGGIGSGSLGLSGNGSFADMEIYNRPDKGTRDDMPFFAVRAEREGEVFDARVLTGDLYRDLMGTYTQDYYHGYGFGAARGTMAGFPHFRHVTFKGEFPTATLSFRDDTFPGAVSLRAFNPMIPTDDKNSSLPAAFFEITFRNTTDKQARYTAAYSFAVPYAKTHPTDISRGRVHGIRLANAAPGDNLLDKRLLPGNMTVATDAPDASVQPSWYRGGWMDGISTFWREFSTAKDLSYRTYPDDIGGGYASLRASVTLAPGESGKLRFVFAWYHPLAARDFPANPGEEPGDTSKITYKNYYATLFKDSGAVAKYGLRHFSSLDRRTNAFRRALFSSTGDSAIIDAAASNLAVLHSPTVVRLEDGTLWGWEGLHEKVGSCSGTCTHVWSYAYALCYLFPQLERSLRETEYTYDTDALGAVRFRTPLPRTLPMAENVVPALDGQMCGVIKTYREWKLSGDNQWLAKWWPVAKRTLDFARSPLSRWKWDADGDGILEGRQHHTLDMEIFGPCAWLEGLYIAALKAGAAMARATEDADAALYEKLAAQGSAFLEKELFNGAFYAQKIDLTDKEILAPYRNIIGTVGNNADYYWNEETGELKYQIGEGCALDQMLAEWHAHLCGLPGVFDPAHKKTALENLYKNNFFPSVRGTVNGWRVFTCNGEAGAMICTFPAGVKAPAIPLPYAEECMHGFEYAFAGLLLAEGEIEKAVAVVRGVRDRYDGAKRNPYNEMECGSNYARSMASFALLPLLAGFTFDMTRGELGFSPKVRDKNGAFRGIYGAADAFGAIVTDKTQTVLSVIEGTLPLSALSLPEDGKVRALLADGKEIPFTQNGAKIAFTVSPIGKELRVVYQN